MTVQEAMQDALQQVKSGTWTPELLDMVRKLLRYYDVFNILRKELPSDQYRAFDDAYCFRIRPEQQKVIELFREEKRRGEKEQWRAMKKAELLKRQRQLLKLQKQRLRDLKQS